MPSPEFIEKSKKASLLRKAGQFSEALAIFEDLWSNDRASCNEWEAWGYAFCLRKLDRSAEALEICREGFKMKKDMDQINSLYAWCIYDTEINKEAVQDEPRFLKAAQGICDLARKDDEFSPLTRTVFHVVKHYDDPSNPAKVLEWVDKLDPAFLSAESHAYTDKSGKSREPASDLEQYYAYRTKALEKLGRFQECKAACEEVLGRLQKFHYSNDIWFTRRIALALGHLGQSAKALELLEEILAKKKDWFIQHEVAEAYAKLGKKDEAYLLGLSAAEAHGEPQMKGELYLLLADLLKQKGMKDESRRHIELAVSLRVEHKWKIPDALKELAGKSGVDISSVEPAPALLKSLEAFWRSELSKTKKYYTGVIKTILPNGKAGFIHADEGQDYYFRFQSFHGTKSSVVPGVKVRFSLQQGFDTKKNVPSLEAVDITIS